jgi:hypothetical protein
MDNQILEKVKECAVSFLMLKTYSTILSQSLKRWSFTSGALLRMSFIGCDEGKNIGRVYSR